MGTIMRTYGGKCKTLNHDILTHANGSCGCDVSILIIKEQNVLQTTSKMSCNLSHVPLLFAGVDLRDVPDFVERSLGLRQFDQVHDDGTPFGFRRPRCAS
eukprot:Blabericola_migrator_1__3362@NODE_1994_length_3449_cov_33_236251_g1258_i1_p5_GENE_NODE_1994_length_3449_cov_33_236251_g1258_i1NODE_1994_length_3449_cov_33_236251_g1258_i1_p5_ORF_typecomplete_len100_score9_49_NODE_1994_length_3449_cov_33_236251_g1258_i129383237